MSDTLQALTLDAEALRAAVAAERATSASLQIVRRQLALLGSEQTYRQSVINRIQAQANRYSDTAALFQALGGGWWNRTRDFDASP